MNLIDYNQAMSALEKECQLLINREQYGAENVLVEHALNVISELPVIRQPEIVRCKDCRHFEPDGVYTMCYRHNGLSPNGDWFCADGERKEGR